MCYLPILGLAEESSPAQDYWCKYFQDLGYDCAKIPAPPKKNAPQKEWEDWYALVTPLLRTTLKSIVNIPNTPGDIQFASSNQTMVYEANENNGIYTFIVERLGGIDGEITVKYTIIDGSALAGRDFDATSGSFTWKDGDDSQNTFTITIKDDSEVEGNETFSLVLTDVKEGSVLETTTVTIVSDDMEVSPGIIQFSQNNYEVTENSRELTFTVKRSGGNTGKVGVNYFTNDGTAIAGMDFEPITGTLTWEDGGNDDEIVTITIRDDDEVEESETFTISLSDITGGATLGTAITLVTINSDDKEILPGKVQFSQQDNYRVNEKEGKLTFTVERSGGSDGEMTVKYTTNDGTALAEHDFDAVNDTLTWKDGENNDKTVTLIIKDDDNVETPETFTITLMDITDNTSLGTITATIISDDINDDKIKTPPKPEPVKVPIVTKPDKPVDVTKPDKPVDVTKPDKPVDVENKPVEKNPIVLEPSDEVGTPSTTTFSPNGGTDCLSNPLQPAKQDFSLNLGDKPISQTFTGGQQQIKLIQPPNGQIVTLLDSSVSENGNATIQFEPREVGTTQFIIGDECGNQVKVNITVNAKEVPDITENSLDTCQSAPEFPLKPEKTEIAMNIGDSYILWFAGGQKKRWLSTPPAGEILVLDSTDFPDEGGARLMLIAAQKGETQLGISDCMGESIVNITVNEKISSCTPLPSEPQEIILLEGEPSLFKTLIGDNVKLVQPPDETVVTLELPIFSAEGLTQLKLTPRKAGNTQIILGSCAGEIVLNIAVLKRGTLAYACQLAGKSDGLCENYEQQQLIKSNSMGININGETIATTAHFEGKLNVIPESQNYVIGQADKITVEFTVIVDEAHVGLPADILIVVERQANGKSPEFFMYDGITWQPWLSSDLSSLVAAKKYDHIPVILETSLDLETLDKSPGKFTVYVGYRLENGTIVFNGNTQFWRANSTSILSESEHAYFTGNVQRKLQNDLTKHILTVTMSIKPNVEHLGKEADIIIVAFYLPDEGNLLRYMQLPSKKWYEWDSESKNLVDAYDDKILENNMEVKIFEGELNIPPGKIEIYVGYRLSGNIVFNGMEPIEIAVP